MLNTFRKMRQKILNREKFTGYLLYAFGEIVLIVFGILIALQLNTWKEENDNRKMIHAYLERLQFDLEQDYNRMLKLDTFYRVRAEIMQKLLRAEFSANETTNEDIGEQFNQVFQFRKFSPKKSTYLTLISDGSLAMIDDKAIADQIINYYEMPFLQWSTEIYENKVLSIDFNKSELYDSRDQLNNETSSNSIPGWDPGKTRYYTDYPKLIETKWARNILTTCLAQANFIFSNIRTGKDLNTKLRDAINSYPEMK